MLAIALFLIEILLLFIFSQLLTKALSQLFMRISHSQATTIQILAFLFLPGVIIHELAHFLVANILFVRTGEIEFLPQIQGNNVKLGSVAIAKTDPLRRFVIGVAPLLFGSGLIFGSFYFFISVFPAFNWQTLLLLYMCFEVGNTMFSSQKDMEGSLVLLALAFVLGLIWWLLGLQLPLNTISQVLSQPLLGIFIQKAVLILAIPLGLDMLFVGLFFLLSHR